MAVELEASARLSSDLANRSELAGATVASKELDALEPAASASGEATTEFGATVEEWLNSPYSIVETQDQGGSDSAETQAGITVTYDAAAVPKSKKTAAALKDLEEGTQTLRTQAEEATSAVEALEEELGTVPAEVDVLEEREEEKVEEEEEQTERCEPPTEGAYPCAGRGLPADAQEITTHDESWAIADTPSGNIRCYIGSPGGVDGVLQCAVNSWDSSMMPNYDPMTDGKTVVHSLANGGPAELGQSGGVPFELPSVETMQYGNVYYWKDFVLASDQSGLTVWSVRSGHGAFFNKQGFHPF